MENEFYRSILDNLFDGVYCVDRDRKIVYWNKAAERISGYTASEVVGTSCGDNILVHVDSRGAGLCKKEACPAWKSMSDGVMMEAEVFLRHKEGHRVPVSARIVPLRDAGGAIVGACELFCDNSRQLALRQRAEDLERISHLDSLTGIGNRRHGQAVLEGSTHELERYGVPFGVMLIDIDHFKGINDRWGHEVGDKVLAFVARTIQNCIRYSDTAVRWGGEEFLVISNHSDGENLHALAERVLALVRQSGFAIGENPISATVSIGATIAKAGEPPGSALRRADGLLYRSKQEGRDRVSLG